MSNSIITFSVQKQTPSYKNKSQMQKRINAKYKN